MLASHPTGTVTFLFTDVEGSTRLWEEYPTAMKAALARHDEIVRQAIETHGGSIIKTTGDGFHAAFDTGLNGVAAILAAQQALSTAGWDEIKPHQLRVRAALHTGEAEERSGDYYGPSLNRAARLMSIAHGGQTLLSTTTANLVRDQLPGDVSLRDLGEHRLKDLVRSERVFQLNVPGLPVEFPPVRSVDSFPNNLPVQLTTFIGRERELEQARTRLDTARLLTMIGPGGTGKTRLSLQLGAELLPYYPDGVWAAELAPITDPGLVLPAVASVFGIREQLGMGVQELLLDFLRAKELLLIVDNCEHLVEACAQLIEQLLRTAPNLKIIASSREALGIPGETVYRVPSLSLPDAASSSRAALAQSESVQLFVERASAANPKFSLNDQNAASIAQIVRRLDGIPLALELAAARVTVFSAEQISSRLDDRFRLLTGGSRTALPRQQTLRALIDWSYDLLSDAERALFRKFSVFAGGCTYEAAEGICTEMDVLNLLTQLVNKSLVAVEDESGSPRYRLLETVRQYARDKLLESGESEAARDTHFDYFYNLAKTAAPMLGSPQAAEWVAKLESEYDNIRAALDWGLEKNVGGVLRMVSNLERFWMRQGHEEEGRQIATEALLRAEKLPMPAGDEAIRQWKGIMGRAWGTLAALAYSQGDNERAAESAGRAATLATEIGDKAGMAQVLAFRASSLMFVAEANDSMQLLEEAIAAGRESGNKEGLALALSFYSQVLTLQGAPDETVQKFAEESSALARESNDKWMVTMGLLGGAMVAKYRGNYAEARKQFSTARPLFAELGDRHRLNMVKSELAHIDRYEGQLEKAEAVYRETIVEWKRLGHRAAIAHQLECFAEIALRRQHYVRAARLFGAAAALREKIGISMTAPEKIEYEKEISSLQSSLEPAAFRTTWTDGQGLNMDEAIQSALESQAKAA